MLLTIIYIFTNILQLSLGQLEVSCNTSDVIDGVPEFWPCHWNCGEIPFSIDFFTTCGKRMATHVYNGHRFLEKRSCLRFVEKPAKELLNLTYLYYTFSDVLENCCFPFYTHQKFGKRFILVTPSCNQPSEVAHSTIHALGLEHVHGEPFYTDQMERVLFPYTCKHYERKLQNFQRSVRQKFSTGVIGMDLRMHMTQSIESEELSWSD